MDNPILEALARSLRSSADVGLGAGETALSIGTGMGAQVLGGMHGYARTVNDLLRGRGKDAAVNAGADAVRDTTERFTYQPRTSVGQRGLENVGKGISTVTEPIMKHVVDPIGERSPLAGAAILGAAELVGPKGKPKGAKVKPHTSPEIVARNEAPRYDPGSPQQLIPGVEPHDAETAHALALRNYIGARDEMSFEDKNRGTRFQHSPLMDGGDGGWRPDYRPRVENEAAGKRPVNTIAAHDITENELERPGPRTVPEGDRMRGRTVQEQVGAENYQRMLAQMERLRGAEGDVRMRGEEMFNARTRELTQQAARLRALRAEPGISDAQRLKIEEELLQVQRSMPVNVGGRMALPSPYEGVGPIDYSDLFGRDITREARQYHDQNPHMLREQERLVRQLRGEPEVREIRRPVAEGHALPDIEGRDPAQMNRDAVEAFLKHAQGNEEMFQYGLMPPAHVRTLDDFAEHFGNYSNEPLHVEWTYADNDEPYKIKREKEHGRGEVMRDSYGEYKLAEAEGGETKYDDYGNPKVFEKEKELTGPPPEGEDVLMGRKEVEKTHEPGDYYRDEDGNYVYAKSEGGEPMRDERGDLKYEEVENPDYRGDSEYDMARLHGPSGYIDIMYDDPASIGATEAGKRGGSLMYQTALAHAARNNIDITGGSLTEINQYRLLSNVLSNIARSGKNTRDLAGTLSGDAPRARGAAAGPEVWRAEAEEGMSRLRDAGVDPDRVTFDPEKGFSIDGKPASPDDVKLNIKELSPAAGVQRGGLGGVGQKSLMRNAVFQWLRHATPEEAQRVALKWPKEWGPIFAGLGAAAIGINALYEGEDNEQNAREKYD